MSFTAKASGMVANAVGGRQLVDYLGTKIAQRNNPSLSIPQTTSGRDALKSGARVATTIGSLAGGAGLARALTKKTATSFRIPGQAKPVKIKYGGKAHINGGRPTWSEGGW